MKELRKKKVYIIYAEKDGETYVVKYKAKTGIIIAPLDGEGYIREYPTLGKARQGRSYLNGAVLYDWETGKSWKQSEGYDLKIAEVETNLNITDIE